MHIAFNASDLGRRRGGNESYLIGLFRGLASLAEVDGIRLSLILSDRGEPVVHAEHGFDTFDTVDVGPYRRLPFLLWQQTATLRQLRPDWYVSTFFLPPVTPCRAAVLVHDLSFRAHPEYFPPSIARYMRLLTGLAIQRAERVIALSNFTHQEIGRFYPAAAAKTSVVYPGVGPEFTAEGEPALDSAVLADLGIRRPYLLAVGNVHPRKNLARLLAAWQHVQQAGYEPPAMVWAGMSRWESKPLLEEAQVAGVQLPGFVAGGQLPALYRQAEALVYPSLYEGFGLPPLEAMACGTPVLASSTTALPEAVGEAALTVNPTKVDALAGGLVQILFDQNLRREVRAKGLVRATQFRWESAARRLIAMLAEAHHEHP